jgi:hypothetical protein
MLPSKYTIDHSGPFPYLNLWPINRSLAPPHLSSRGRSFSSLVRLLMRVSFLMCVMVVVIRLYNSSPVQNPLPERFCVAFLSESLYKTIRCSTPSPRPLFFNSF